MKKIAKVLFIICTSIMCSGCITASLVTHAGIFKRFDKKTTDISWVADYPREEVWFYSGKNKLQGYIYGRDKDKGLIIFSIGIHSYTDHYARFIRFLVDEGWCVFTYNGTGVAGSEGSSMRGLSQSVIDLNAALSYAGSSKAFLGKQIVLVGFSMGGYAAPTVLNFDKNVNINAVVSICAFNSVKGLYKYQTSNAVGPFHYLIYPQSWLLQKMLFGEFANLTAAGGINRMNIPVLIMVNAKDDFLPPDKVGIYAYKDNIVNPYVEYIYLENESKSHGFPSTAVFPMIGQFLEKVRQNP